MIGLQVLEVAAGLVFLFLSVSLLATIVQEGIAGLLKLRARNLNRAIAQLVRDPKVAAALYRHPLLLGPYPLSSKPSKSAWALPSYISSRNFAYALLDVLGERSNIPTQGLTALVSKADSLVEGVEDPDLKRLMSLFVGDTHELAARGEDAAAILQARLEDWFDDAMRRASGWYKRRTQALTLLIGLVLAVALNADPFHVAERLWSDSNLRASVTAAAELHVAPASSPAGAAASPTAMSEAITNQLARIESAELPIGRTASGKLVQRTLSPQYPLWLVALGWLMTALATTLGASFWFDWLQRLLKIRSSVTEVVASGTTRPGSASPKTEASIR